MVCKRWIQPVWCHLSSWVLLLSSSCFETRCDERGVAHIGKPRTTYLQDRPTLKHALLYQMLNTHTDHILQNHDLKKVTETINLSESVWSSHSSRQHRVIFPLICNTRWGRRTQFQTSSGKMLIDFAMTFWYACPKVITDVCKK